MQIIEKPSILYRMTDFLMRHRVRGSNVLFNLARNQPQICRFPLDSSVSVYAPLWTDNVWSEDRVRAYESALIGRLVGELSRLPRPVTFIDCGASFGLVTARLAALCPYLESIEAFEPNPDLFLVLQRNADNLPLRVHAHLAAVSNFSGHGKLKSPAYDISPDAMYLEQSASGSIAVVTIDSLRLMSRSIAIKIDVEGGERAVLEGAMGTLSQAPAFVVTIEANPRVAERTGIDAIECIRLIAKSRPVIAYVAERVQAPLDLTKSFAEQANPGGQVLNIICRSA